VHGDELRTQLKLADSEIGRIVGEMNSAKTRLSELSHELESADEEDIRSMEQRRSEVGKQRDALLRSAGEIERDIRGAKADITSAEIALRSAKAASAEAEIAQRRMVAAEDVRQALEEMLRLRTDDVRRDLDKRIKAVYEQVVKKRQVPRLSSNFDLLLEEEVEGRLVEKAMSTGEAQVLTLSFVGGLADLARSAYETARTGASNPLVNATGGIFPFVADAIFGTLDESFRKEVSNLLPGLAPQVVLFLSKAQSSGEVRSELEPRVGAVAVIEARMARSDVDPEFIMLDGREYPYVSVDPGDQDTSQIVTVREPEDVK
jgi:DNA sulfur modification protein DndD